MSLMKRQHELVSKCSEQAHRRPDKQASSCVSFLLILAIIVVHATNCVVQISALNFEQDLYQVRSSRSELANTNVGRDNEDELRTLSGDDDLSELESGDENSILSPDARSPAPATKEIYLLEDKDYPRSLFEDYPRRVGQVCGITTLASNDVAIFHRSTRHWTGATFNESSKQIPAHLREDLIKNDTIMIIDRENGGSVTSFGANLFYMPHSIASDQEGNLWVSDVARHQVMRLPISSVRQAILEEQLLQVARHTNHSAAGPLVRRQIWPDIILGEAFMPGNDYAHFCQPSEIAVSSSGQLVFVADGYCNGRVMVFTGAGSFIGSFGERENLAVVHSLALIEERNLICVADREHGRILCYHAGLDGELDRLGELMHQVDYPLGRVFAITTLSEDHLLVSSNQVGTNRYDLTILNPFKNELKLVWISTDLLEPHSLASTRDRQVAYAADISKDAYKKVFKFDIIKRRS